MESTIIKIDYKKKLKHLYRPSAKKCKLVEVPPMNFLMVDGAGNPNSAQAYKDAIETLYAVSYALKFMIKKGELAVDYGVMPLESLWWTEGMDELDANDKENWLWTAMIMQPEYVTAELVEIAKETVARKKNLPALPKLRFEAFQEGLVAQIMHLGPYAEEDSTIAKLHAFIAEQGHKQRGKHHGIYLSDARRTAPEKLKTIVRQPAV